MRKVFIFFGLIFFGSNGFSQNAKDYLCLDSTIVLYYQFHSGDTCTIQFDSSFVYQNDTICFYTRTFLGHDKGVTLFYAYNGNVLTEGNYIVNGKFRGTNELDTKIEIVGLGEEVDTAYSISFDMSTTEFIQTNRFLENYTDSYGNKHQNVVEVDQENLTDDFHYRTYYAPGIGVVSRGGGEMEFIRMERVGLKD